MTDNIANGLEGVAKDNYGSNYTEHLFEQYKLYVEMADKISARRQTANTFFLTINTAVVALLGAVLPSTDRLLNTAWYVVVGLAGLLLCFFWFQLLSSYRNLNTAKFNIVHEIERKLPIRPYVAEWASVGKEKDGKSYLPFTHVETRVPWIFAALYVALTVIALVHGV
jgi:uncharacterized membrane protein YuzA (DUF378 family)